MKRILLIAFMLMLVPLCLLSAEDLVIKLTNGTMLRIPVETIESITFGLTHTNPTTPTIPADPLVGKWEGSESDRGLGFEFKLNGDFIYSKDGFNLSGTWSKIGNKLSMLMGGKEEVFTYYVEGDNLTLYNSTGTTVKMIRIASQIPNPPIYQGSATGLVFYDKGYYSEGWRYLEAAPASTEWSEIAWGSAGIVVGATGAQVGEGESNTQRIVSKFGDSAPFGIGSLYAARLCADFVYRGYDDWFLPSKGELDLMYQQRTSIGGFSTTGNYWSSTEENSISSWTQGFLSRNQTTWTKNIPLRVRAIRAF